jgi:hypothetical protein
MSMRSWVRNVIARPATRPIRKAPHLARLAVEALEDRTVPSTFTVTNTLDDGSVGSLRWAVGQANSQAGADTINFDSTVFSTRQTISLTSGQLTLTDVATTTISGPGAGLLSISGNNASRVFAVNGGAAAALSGLTITGGMVTDRGGGLSNDGTVTLIDCTISGNSADIGGGIRTYGTTTLSNCTVSGNSAGNIGGGLFQAAGTTTLSNCTFSGNSAGNLGGGLWSQRSTTTLSNCTFSGNSAGTQGGGLVLAATTSTLSNCTISGNSAASAGGVYSGGSTATLGNTIVAGNTASDRPDVGGTFNSSGNNLIGKSDGATGWVGSDLTGTIAAPLNPQLAALASNGGPTQTLALLPGSPAIAAGNATGAPSTDQRGIGRVGAVDIGAFESSGFTIAVTSGSGQATLGNTAFFAPLVVTVTANNPNEPVAGGLVTFTPPLSGASATLSPTPAIIKADGTASVTATANDVRGAYTVTASASEATPASFALTNELQPTFAGLSSATITYGTSSLAFTGALVAGATPATGGVTVTISGNGITPLSQSTTIGADGTFSATIITASLPANPSSPYTVISTYAAQDDFRAASDTSTTLTVNKADATVVVTPYRVTYDGSPHTATVTSITGVNGETGATVGTVTLNTTHTNAGTYSSDSWSFTGTANYNDIASTTITDTIDKTNYLNPATGDRSGAFAGLSAQQRFIQALYLDALGRAGSVAELNLWAPILNGPNGQAVVARGIENSPEGRDNLVKGWYRTYLGRSADGVEERGHVAALLAGMTEEAVLGGILASPEFFAHAQTLLSTGTPQERFVQALYTLLLNRPAGSGEVAGQVAASSGGQSRAQVAMNFLRRQEFRTDLVALYYSTFLHRTASAAESNDWVFSQLDANMLRLSFESSPEFFVNG